MKHYAHQPINVAYYPPLYKRIGWKIFNLRARGKHPEYSVPPEPYVDTIAVLVGAKMDFADRIRVLFGATVEFCVFIDTKQVTSNDRRIGHSMILKA